MSNGSLRARFHDLGSSRRRVVVGVSVVAVVTSIVGVRALTSRESGPHIDAFDCTKDEVFGCPDESTTTEEPVAPSEPTVSSVLEPTTAPTTVTTRKPATTTTTRQASKSTAVLDILGKPASSAEADRIIATSGCRIPRQTYIPGNPYIASGSGYQCDSSGFGLSLSSGGNIGGISFYDEGVDGFSRYTGALPFGLHWGDDRVTLEKFFDQKLGPPVIRSAPTGYSWDTDPSYGDNYAVTGQEPMESLELEFTPDSQRLRSVGIGTSKPWCLDNCYHPDSPTTTEPAPSESDWSDD